MNLRSFLTGTVLLLSLSIAPLAATAQLSVRVEPHTEIQENDCILAMVSPGNAAAALIGFDPERVNQIGYLPSTARAALSLMYYGPPADERLKTEEAVRAVLQHLENTEATDYYRLLGIVFSNAHTALSDNSERNHDTKNNSLRFSKIGTWPEELDDAACLAHASITLAYATVLD